MQSKINIVFADLTHTGVGINADVFPFGVGLVAAYALQELRDQIDTSIFKFPEDLNRALKQGAPDLLCFANYVWNGTLSYKFAEYMKHTHPQVVVVFGGPDFPLPEDERKDFLLARPAIDFYIKWDGEHAFVRFLTKLVDDSLNVERFKSHGVISENLCYVDGNGQYIEGPNHRVQDLMTIPSPYLMGILDEYFNYPIMPVVETIRGCPYSCTFCNDGSVLRNKIYKKSVDFIRDELEYIAAKPKQSNQLEIADLNFGMYPEDIETAKIIRAIREKYGWPDRIQGSMGKSNPARLLEVVRVINEGNSGIIKLGSSLQSTDDQVLQKIKRRNLSIPQLLEMRQDRRNTNSNNMQDFTELIVPLPGETVAKHMRSLGDVVDVVKMNNIDVHQLTMLRGSEMATRSQRAELGLDVRYRMFVGCLGIYDIGDERIPCAEIEEVVIATKTMPFEDYLECRRMDFLIKLFVDNDPFKELLGVVRKRDLSAFDVLRWMRHNCFVKYESLSNLLDEFTARTKGPLYEDLERLERYASDIENIQNIISGNHVQNEMLSCRVIAFRNCFEDMASALGESILAYLSLRQALTPDIESYVGDAIRFCGYRRFDFDDYESVKEAEFDFDFVSAEGFGFEIDPTDFKKKMRIRFYYEDEALLYIQRQVDRWGAGTLYSWGKFIQKSNSLRTRRQICEVALGPDARRMSVASSI